MWYCKVSVFHVLFLYKIFCTSFTTTFYNGVYWKHFLGTKLFDSFAFACSLCICYVQCPSNKLCSNTFHIYTLVNTLPTKHLNFPCFKSSMCLPVLHNIYLHPVSTTTCHIGSNTHFRYFCQKHDSHSTAIVWKILLHFLYSTCTCHFYAT